MTEKEFEKQQKGWNKDIAEDTKTSYEFFTKPENDLQALIPLLLKYQKDADREKYDDLSDAFFTSHARWGFCGVDLSKLDLSMFSKESLARITFDTATKWPPKSKLPKGFNPAEILEKAKTHKGLGVEELHKQGIAGKGVKVAYFDTSFDVEHAEFNGRKIEYVSYQKNEQYNFHGYAVVSRLVGKNTGIVPNAELTYFDSSTGEDIVVIIKNELKALKEIIKRLKNGENFVTIGLSGSIPCHFDIALNKKLITEEEKSKLLQEYNELLKQLKSYDCQIISAEEFWDSGFTYAHKVDPLTDNEDLENYAQFGRIKGQVSVVEADKVVPSAYTKNGYKYENTMGCASWSIPQVVGLYCLAKQVNPDITYEEFVDITKQTAHKPNKNGVRLIDAVALIKEVELSKKNENNVQV